MIEAKWFRFLWKKESQKCVLRWISRISNQTREFFIFEFQVWNVSTNLIVSFFLEMWMDIHRFHQNHIETRWRKKFRSSELTECSAGYISYDEQTMFQKLWKFRLHEYQMIAICAQQSWICIWKKSTNGNSNITHYRKGPVNVELVSKCMRNIVDSLLKQFFFQQGVHSIRSECIISITAARKKINIGPECVE